MRQMNIDNPLLGAPRIHGELLKLGFEVAQSMEAKYLVNLAHRGLSRRCNITAANEGRPGLSRTLQN
jgi:hypothetical protein